MNFSKWLAGIYMRMIGMEIIYPYPLPDKCVIAVVPHTSNWDFPIGLCVRPLLNERIHFVGKDSLFRWPIGGLMKKLGGVPVDRSQRNNFVQAVADIFKKRDHFRLTLAPEGTRSKVDELKSGFYYIAKEAGVPVVCCAFDWGKGEVRFDKPYMPTDDKEADFEYFYDFFEGSVGYQPKNNFDRPTK
ncbi:MAG: 1-acyl-sn-glycerol-3-phosphate acyltransferase [Bacteroidota bacterium]